MFITISPYEWTFPFPPWLENLRALTGYGPTNLAQLETMHIVNVLEQLVRGYMCSSNTNRWVNHLFSYKHKKNKKKVLKYFYRFEFQDRGTVHLHMLVWLKDVTKIKLDAIHADIPWSNKLLAQQVLNLQPSDKPGVSFFQQETRVSYHNGKQILQLFHPSEAFANNLRAYISTILPSLKCRMDIQTSDGKGMLLRYAASYVSKWHDAFQFVQVHIRQHIDICEDFVLVSQKGGCLYPLKRSLGLKVELNSFHPFHKVRPTLQCMKNIAKDQLTKKVFHIFSGYECMTQKKI